MVLLNRQPMRVRYPSPFPPNAWTCVLAAFYSCIRNTMRISQSRPMRNHFQIPTHRQRIGRDTYFLRMSLRCAYCCLSCIPICPRSKRRLEFSPSHATIDKIFPRVAPSGRNREIENTDRRGAKNPFFISRPPSRRRIDDNAFEMRIVRRSGSPPPSFLSF